MISTGMQIKFIVFTGPHKKPAMLTFGPGLNLVYGPSNTGKSAVLDGIDFMLGRTRQLKEIPEHDGYERILLGIEFADSEIFTFVRSIEGGDFECFDGTHKTRPNDIPPIILKAKKPTKQLKSISTFILEKINVADRKLKKNVKNELVNLTLRNSIDLSVITETNIQKESSPYICNQVIKQTEHRSRLKFMLTGVDDSALLPTEIAKKKLSRAAKIEILNELIEEKKDLLESTHSRETTLSEFKEQHIKISSTIDNKRFILDANEEKYSSLVLTRSEVRQKLEKFSDRVSEITEMLTRFDLLKEQYSSDIARLDNIEETGFLLAALPSDRCPVCGSDTTTLTPHVNCYANINDVASAASSEKIKINALHKDLLLTMKALELEHDRISKEIPSLSQNLASIVEKVSYLSPKLTIQRSNFSDLYAKKSNIAKSIEQHEQLITLMLKKDLLEKDKPQKAAPKQDDSERSLPTNSLFNLSTSVKSILNDLGLPNSSDVHFDKETDDFVINGKHRTSNGKGHRAITHAAATLGLMKYSEENDLPHMGFTILDSPLLAYEEPEDKADDLSGTEVNVNFFDMLYKWNTKQIIVFENKKSIPHQYASGDQIVQFTKNNKDRYGFFPM